MNGAQADVSVLVPAAGRGERLGLGPKADITLNGRPLVDWVAHKALQLGAEVLVACAPGQPAPAGCQRVEGGATRQQSVHRLVHAAREPWVVVWDAARPFGSVAQARAVLALARTGGAAAALRHGATHEAERFETPLAFDRALLLAVADQAERKGWAAASTIALVLRAGHAVQTLPGEPHNLKLTTPRDWALAQGLVDWLG